MQRNQSGSSSRTDRDTYAEDGSDEGGPEDDHVSVTSNVSEAGSSPIEKARITDAEKHRLLSNQELMHKPRVVKAVQQVASAKVANDGTSTVGEVKTLTVPPPPMRPSTKNPDYVKESNKCRVTELLSLKTELVKVIQRFYETSFYGRSMPPIADSIVVFDVQVVRVSSRSFYSGIACQHSTGLYAPERTGSSRTFDSVCFTWPYCVAAWVYRRSCKDQRGQAELLRFGL